MKEINPHKVVVCAILIFAYAMISFAVLGVHVPKMLREPDTALNITAVVLVAAWLLFTYYAVALIRKRKSKPVKRNRRK